MANKIIRQQKKTLGKESLKKMETYRKNPRIFFEKCTAIKNSFKARSSTTSRIVSHCHMSKIFILKLHTKFS